MAKPYNLKIVAPGKKAIDKEIEALIVSTSNGEVEIKADHTPIILSTVPEATIIINLSGEKEVLFTSTGVLTFKNNELKFCCDALESKEEIDINRAEGAKGRAEERLEKKKDVDIQRAKRALARSMARIKVSSINDK